MARVSVKIKAEARRQASKDTHINFGLMIFTKVDDHWDAHSVVWAMDRGLLRTNGNKALKKFGLIDRVSPLSPKNAVKFHKSLTKELVRYFDAEEALYIKDNSLLDLVYGWLLSRVVAYNLKLPTRGGILLGAIYNNKDDKSPLTCEYMSENLPAEVDSKATKMLEIISDLSLRTQYK
jgi:hypothetical protein